MGELVKEANKKFLKIRMGEDDEFEKKREEELEKFMEEAESEVEFPGKKGVSFASREYETFLEEEKEHKKRSWYEKLCDWSKKIIKIEPSEERKEELQRAIDFAYLQITPGGAYSFAILAGISIIVLSFLLLLLGVAGPIFALFIAALGGVSIYLLTEFPKSQARLFRVKASNEIVLAVLYMVIYMRTTPNLEGAIRFTAQHLRGPLSLDFKKLLWDIETRTYTSIKAALVDYMDKWKGNEAFVEAIQIIQNSMEQDKEKRKAMLDEAVNTMMSGSREKMEEYANSLELPIMVIHTLGVMLPIMVLVMFPIIILFLHETVKPVFLVLGYDVILPLIIYFTSQRTLEYRPLGFSAPDISMHPDYTEAGKLSILGKEIKIWPVAVLASVGVIVAGIAMLGSFSTSSLSRIASSLVITWGVGIGPTIYFFLDSRGKAKIREKIKSLESEFNEALFSLGNRLSLGKPIEKAMEDTVRKNEDLEISNLFRKALRNMKKGGMNLKNSLFDKKFGAVWSYPSKLIISVLRIVVESAEKSVRIASLSSISISQYLKQTKSLEQNLKDMLSSETTSMQFLGSFLGPLVAGVSVTMATIMILIFRKLGASLKQIQAGAEVPGGVGLKGMMIGGWGAVGQIVPIFVIQIVVGIYVIETSYLLSMLSSGIQNGPGDKIARRQAAGLTIFIGLLVYSFALLLTYTLFGTMLKTLIGGGLI